MYASKAVCAETATADANASINMIAVFLMIFCVLSVYLLLLIPDDEDEELLLMPDEELRLMPDDEELLL